MRLSLFCLVLAVAAFVALPETKGAPTPNQSESISVSQEKRSERSAQEEREAAESESRSSNGFVSGSKSLSESKQSSLSDEEKSHSVAESKTATGTKKVEKSVKKKKTVTVSEKKTVLMYYLVSYKKLPSQKPDETRIQYYKRLFPKEQDLNVFYRKVFKAYENETPNVYIERVEYIFTEVYPELDCRLDVSWLEQFDHYYTIKYSRKVDETDESYYPRVLARWSGETCEHYKKRMECLVEALDEEDFSHITFNDSEVGYKIGVKKAGEKKTTSATAGAAVSSQSSTSSKKSKKQAESEDASETSVSRTSSTGSSSASNKSLKKKKELEETEEEVKSQAYRVAYTKLPKKSNDESVLDYYKNFFGKYDCKTISEETRSELYLRILIQYKGESCADYVQRVDYLFDTVYPELDARTNVELISLLEHYYKEKYARTSTETEEQWFKRVLTRRSSETTQQYRSRVECLQKTYKEVSWSKVTVDEKSETGYRLTTTKTENTEESEKKVKSKNVVKSVSEEDDSDSDSSEEKKSCSCNKNAKKTETTEEKEKVKSKSVRKSSKEDDSSEEKVVKKTCPCKKRAKKRACGCKRARKACGCKKAAAKKTQSTETKEVSQKSSNSKEEIKRKYSRTEGEDITSYYKRIVTKSSSTMTTEEYIETITSIREAYPKLDLWYDVKFIDYVKNYYNALYEKKSSETEESYYKRIVTKESYETDECFAKRLEVVHRLYPTLSLWYSESYYKSFTRKYYKTYYKKSSTEDETTYYSRITTKLAEESEEDYINRIALIKRTYHTLPVWYSKDYLSVTRSYYTAKYSKLSTEKEETYFKRIVKKESYESDEEWAKRVEVVREVFPTLTLWSDEKYYESTKKYIQTIYKRSQSEDETTYYSRLVQKSEKESTSEYYNRISLIKRTYSSLPFWYSKSYLSLTKQYYTAKYTKQSTEKDEVYYKRIVTREVGETDEEWAQRVEIVHSLNPSLSLWYDSQYYETYTKQVYSSVYKQSSSEDVTAYYTRICSKFDQESDSAYAKRLTLLKKTFSSLDLWYSTKYSSIVKRYYSLTYAKQSGETDEAYVTRLLRKEGVDTSDEIYAKRVHLVHTLTASSSVWSQSCFYEKYLSAYYSTYYARASGVSCEAWLTTVLTPLAGECEDDAVARVTLIKRAVSNDCDCWTDAVLTKVAKDSCFSSEYISKIRSACFTTSVTTSSSSSSSSSVASSSSASESEEYTTVSRGC